MNIKKMYIEYYQAMGIAWLLIPYDKTLFPKLIKMGVKYNDYRPHKNRYMNAYDDLEGAYAYLSTPFDKRLTIETYKHKVTKNLRNFISEEDWKNLTKTIKERARCRCEYCETYDENLDCHERYIYDSKTNTQHLVGFESVCRKCHDVIHLTQNYKKKGGSLKEEEEWYKDKITHMSKVTHIPYKELEKEYKAAKIEFAKEYMDVTLNFQYVLDCFKDVLSDKAIEQIKYVNKFGDVPLDEFDARKLIFKVFEGNLGSNIKSIESSGNKITLENREEEICTYTYTNVIFNKKYTFKWNTEYKIFKGIKEVKGVNND